MNDKEIKIGTNSCIHSPKIPNNIGRMDLIPYINENQNLWKFCWSCYKIEQILNNDEFRYFYLVTLISSDTIIDIESANKCIDKLNEIKLVLPYLNITDKIRKETLKYIRKGLKIAKRDLKLFEEENKK